MRRATRASFSRFRGRATTTKGGHWGVQEAAHADLIPVDGNPLQNLDFVADPDKNFVLIKRDARIYKNTVN